MTHHITTEARLRACHDHMKACEKLATCNSESALLEWAFITIFGALLALAFFFGV